MRIMQKKIFIKKFNFKTTVINNLVVIMLLFILSLSLFGCSLRCSKKAILKEKGLIETQSIPKKIFTQDELFYINLRNYLIRNLLAKEDIKIMFTLRKIPFDHPIDRILKSYSITNSVKWMDSFLKEMKENRNHEFVSEKERIIVLSDYIGEKFNIAEYKLTIWRNEAIKFITIFDMSKFSYLDKYSINGKEIYEVR